MSASDYDPGELRWSSPRGLGGTERVRLAKRIYRGNAYADLRVEYYDHDTGRWLPTRKGVSIRLTELNALGMAFLDLDMDRIVPDDPKSTHPDPQVVKGHGHDLFRPSPTEEVPS